MKRDPRASIAPGRRLREQLGFAPSTVGVSHRSSHSPRQQAGAVAVDRDDQMVWVQPPPAQWSTSRQHDQTVVIGLGNDIAGDDAVGILAARQLQHLLQDRPDVSVTELPWAGFSLLSALRGQSRAVLLDSLRSGLYAPGTVVRLSESDFAGSVRLNSFHDLNYPTALAFGRALGWPMPSRVDIFAVEGSDFDTFTTSLSSVVENALEELVAQVIATLNTEAGNPRRSDVGMEVRHGRGL